MTNRYAELTVAAIAVVATIGIAYCEIKRRELTREREQNLSNYLKKIQQDRNKTA